MDEFTKQIKELKSKYIVSANDYYSNSTLVFRLIYDQQIFDRYYECVNEFNRLLGGIYSDGNVEKALNSKKDKSKYARNILHSRAMGCLAIVDAIDKLEHLFSTMTQHQIKGYRNLLRVRAQLLEISKNSLTWANEISTKFNFPPILFNVEKNYRKM